MALASTAKSRARSALLGVFVGDAAALGLHWVYDQAVVQTKIAGNGGVAEFTDAIAVENPFHKKVHAGDLSHYADHTRVALESMVECKGIDLADFHTKYVAYFGSPTYERYLDHATKELLKSGAAGGGVADVQNGAIGKAAAVAVYTASKSDEEFERIVVDAIKSTHDDPTDGSALPFAVASAWLIRKLIKDEGVPIAQAVEDLASYAKSSAIPGVAKKVTAAIEKVQAKLRDNPEVSAEAFGKEVGQHCKMTSSFPLALRILLDPNSTSFESIVRKEITCAGDSCGRLLLTGAVGGILHGVPEEWLNKLTIKDHLVDLVDRWVELSELQ
eukprot:TRINITY_DN396_c0_g1_i1.p2 TRINITY_DN396_c0_g1~~TRINITY_DN396_c0_g1_i1.p2  ORF type:complete len:330 (-),score=102.96 TRINITY_DN396_c0_g1_i1:370-1359(-)